FENVEELNQELKRHISVIERSNDEHKRVLRKRDKELEQVKNDFEQNLKNATILNNKCTKQEAELNILRLENSSLSEELKLMRENVSRCEDEQRRLRKDCDQALNFIHDGIPELCLDEGIHDHNRNGALQEHLKKIPSLMQQLTGDRENLKTKNQLLLQFVHGLSYDLNDCQSGQKKYKLLKAHSKQQQLLLNQLESHVRFYESVFKEKGFFPTIEYASGSTVASAPDVIDKTNSMCLPDRTNGSCEWKLFGWNPYHGCGYNQQISSSCMNFYGKNSLNTKNQSRLFSSFCFPKQQLELFWYSFTVQLPENVTMINVVTDTNGIASNHSLIIKDLSIQQCHRITTLPISLPMNTTILSSRLNRKKTFWIQYRWILIIGTLVVLFTSLIIVITINLYISDRIFHQEPTVTERKQITSMNLSQHFYEEPVSIVLTPPIDISVYDHVRDNYRVDILFSFKTKKSSFATMSSTITDGDNHRKQDKYESIFKHYGFQMRAQHLDHQNEKNNIEINSDLNKYKRILHDIKTRFLQRNESNKKEKKTRTITSKTQQAISKSSPTKSKRKKDSKKEGTKQNRENVIKITLPDEAKARKTTYSKQQQKTNENQRISNTDSSLPITLSNSPSITTMKTAQKLPIVNSKSHQSISDIQSNRISTKLQSTDQIISSTLSFHQTKSGESNAKINAQQNRLGLSSTTNNFESTWDTDEITKFTRDIFKRSSTKPIIRSHRIRLKCAEDSDDYLSKYSQRRTHCLDLFEEYVNGLKRPFGIIRDAASDPPVFDPGLTIMGPRVKKDASVIDKEEFQAIKMINSIEPRKKYALVHEQIGIFVIGGYNLFVRIPEQQEPDKDYLFKSDGSIVRISRLSPCRVHFGVYTDGDAIYVAGGQKINNELLDDIQRLNLRTLKWEYVATLLNPIAASAMTVDEQRIYIVGGYDIFKNQTFFESTLTIYNMTTLQFENGNDLPSPRCRSLVVVVDNALFCVSGLIERRNHNGNKKIKISTDILKWTQEAPAWVKISQTPELSKLHALSFNDPFLEVTKRNLSDEHGTSETIAEAYYDFRTNLWANGSAPASAKTIPLTKQEHSSSAAKISDKSASRTTKTKKVTVAKTSSKSNPISKTKSTSKSKVCQHRPYECIQVSYRGIRKCITNFNRLTTVSHVIDALLDDLSERRYLSANDCCLYIERQPYLFPLKSTDFIQDILLRYTATHVHFKLSFKRNSSPSRFAQRKRLLRTAGYIQPSPVINAYEQLKIQESLIRRQHDIITQLRKTNLSNDSRIQQNGASNYGNYLDWITQNEHNGDMSDDSKTSLDLMSTSRRHSRQDEYLKAVNQETVNSSRSLSRVRFRPSTIINTDEISTSLTQVKSILKKGATNYSHIPRTSSVDRDINRLISTKQRRNSLYTFDDADDDNLTDRSTTDSCLGSLSSDDNNSYVINQQQLETLV
ncbi:unnamed protein product, partial [Rotaria magnacalcarata]